MPEGQPAPTYTTYHDHPILQPPGQPLVEFDREGTIHRKLCNPERARDALLVFFLDQVLDRRVGQEHNRGEPPTTTEGGVRETFRLWVSYRVVRECDWRASSDLRKPSENLSIWEGAVDDVRCAEGLEVRLVLEGRRGDNRREAVQPSGLDY